MNEFENTDRVAMILILHPKNEIRTGKNLQILDEKLEQKVEITQIK